MSSVIAGNANRTSLPCATIPVPSADPSETRRFLKALSGLEEAAFTFQTFPEAGGKALILHGTYGECEAQLQTLNSQGACICVTVNETDLSGRKAANVRRVRSLFVDLDQPEADPFGRLAQAGLPPNIVVESSPGKAHAYWLIQDCPLDQFSAMQAKLIEHFSADPACKDLPRLMRLPGCIHWKGEPFLSRIHQISHENPYSLAQIDAWLSGNERKGNEVAVRAPTVSISADRAYPIDPAGVLYGVQEGARDDSLFRLACSLRAQAFSLDEARSLLLQAAANCTPPFPESEALRKLEQAWKYPEGSSLEKFTDVGNAKRLVALFGSKVRWVIQFKKWLLWRDGHWDFDVANDIMQHAKATASSIYSEAAKVSDAALAKSISKHAWGTQQLHKLNAMIELARTEPGVSIGQQALDADPMALGVLNGVVDLRTGTLRPSTPRDFITKRVAVAFDPKAECPTWVAFLRKVMGGKSELISFLQRTLGYSLTGLTNEQCLFFLFGMGSNGKSTFLNTVRELLGGYAAQCQPDTLMTKARDGGANNDIARLRGARFVSTIEAEEGKRFGEALIKQMTGDDTIVARFLFQEHFEYRPQFKIWLAANHKPIIRGDDHAIWRRIKLIPFIVTISEEEKDRGLIEKLAAEHAGILRWAVEGCLAWQREGLNAPDTVKQATEVYRAEMDVFGTWLKECCECKPTSEALAKELYQSYRNWCEETETYVLSQMKFSLKLKERGFPSEHTRAGTLYHGVCLGEHLV